MLLDCFTIPVAAVLLYVVFGTKYGFGNVLGVLVAMAGMGLTVFCDVQSRDGKMGTRAQNVVVLLRFVWAATITFVIYTLAPFIINCLCLRTICEQ